MRGAAGRACLPLVAALLALGVGCAPAHTRSASTKPPPNAPPLRGDHEEPELIRVVHVVKPGQTLYRIAKAYELTADELMAANGISDPRTLAVGQELLIPGASEVMPVDGSTAPPPKPSDPKRPPAEVKTASAQPRLDEALPPDPRKGTLSWPLRGVLYGRFGKKGKEPHDGVDLAAPAGTPVKTAGPGKVLYAGEQRGYGLLVIVEHEGDLMSLYAHNRDLRVKTGQKVREGQVIATVGNSGRTSGPHLHFEVRKNGRPVDPMIYLGPVPPKP